MEENMWSKWNYMEKKEKQKERERERKRKKEKKSMYWLVYLEADIDVNSQLAKDAYLLWSI